MILWSSFVILGTGSAIDFTNEFVVILILGFVVILIVGFMVGFAVILIVGFMVDLSVLGF